LSRSYLLLKSLLNYMHFYYYLLEILICLILFLLKVFIIYFQIKIFFVFQQLFFINFFYVILIFHFTSFITLLYSFSFYYDFSYLLKARIFSFNLINFAKYSMFQLTKKEIKHFQQNLIHYFNISNFNFNYSFNLFILKIILILLHFQLLLHYYYYPNQELLFSISDPLKIINYIPKQNSFL
jgi:hypothetical protein